MKGPGTFCPHPSHRSRKLNNKQEEEEKKKIKECMSDPSVNLLPGLELYTVSKHTTKDSRILSKEEDHEFHFELIKTDHSVGILHQSSKKVEQQQVSMHALRKCVCLILVLTTRFGDSDFCRRRTTKESKIVIEEDQVSVEMIKM